MGNSESTGNQAIRSSVDRTATSNNNPPRGRSPPRSSAATGYPDNGPIGDSVNNPSHDGPGCYRMPGTPRNQRFYVTIPRGVRPGQHFAVLVNGQQMMVKCPDTNKPGDRLIVTAPRQQSQQYVVIVPPNVRPLEQFRVMINSQEVMVTCPRGVRTGQRVTFTLPTPQERTATHAAPNHQMYEVIVPEGVKSGQTFALLANNQKVMVTCPPNVKPGQKIRFQLPIQLSQEELQGIKVSYDKDGWMRCLGQDLKFHWVYNTSEEPKKTDFKTYFDIDAHAFVRELVPLGNNQFKLNCMAATEYAIETSVKGTNVNYNLLNSIAQLPFQSKVDWLKTQFAAIRIPWEEGHIKIKVRRSSLMQDAMDAIGSIQQADMKKIFRFEFIGEPALDAGGVAREFYMCICEQLFNPDCGLFLYSAVNQMCMQFNPNSEIANEHHLKYFFMCGRILGKALMDGQITPVHLVQPLYKHLMGWPINMRDLEHIDDEIYRNLLELLNFDDVGMLYLDFVVTEDKLGQVQTVDLIEGGGDITVENDNLPEYLIAQVRYRLLDRIKDQLAQFLRGFYDVVPEPLLSVFDFQEIELLLHGLPNIDMPDWVKFTDYTGEFTNKPNHKVVQWFWEIVGGFEQEQKAKLLQFVTGTSGVPVQGFAFLQGNDGNIRKFTIHGDSNVKVFPRAHTCFNRIDMPIYKTKAEMSKYLSMAISMESSGFDIE